MCAELGGRLVPVRPTRSWGVTSEVPELLLGARVTRLRGGMLRRPLLLMLVYPVGRRPGEPSMGPGVRTPWVREGGGDYMGIPEPAEVPEKRVAPPVSVHEPASRRARRHVMGMRVDLYTCEWERTCAAQRGKFRKHLKRERRRVLWIPSAMKRRRETVELSVEACKLQYQM